MVNWEGWKLAFFVQDCQVTKLAYIMIQLDVYSTIILSLSPEFLAQPNPTVVFASDRGQASK